MTVKILLFFTLYLMSVSGGASREVTGYPGGGALIKCKYERSYTSNKKYFCKSSWTNCADQISTGVSNEWKNIGRFSLFDNTSAAEFWVLIRELTVEDSGTYQCGVDIDWNKDLYTPVELKIKEDQDHEKSITVNGDVGGNVNISCKYPQSSSSKPRFLCRRVGSDDCNYKASVNESRRWIKEGKFSLYDDQAQQTFTVSINNLTNKDSGEYWCGAESDWESDHGYKVYITQINLRVTAPVKMTTLNIMPTSPKENDGIYQEIDKQQQGPAMKSPFTTISSPAEGPNDAPIYSTIDEPTELTLYCTTTLP
ncbi:polymeric immunoglobulin receptor-like [Salminus brasiliensis]|uniref:polymeric immunoglobulin receptor-like n=1 Tax=Salminus brasiliensis TaxID=930266 RepID=UPI003B837292